MEINNIPKTNPQHIINKNIIQQALPTPTTLKKDDEQKNIYINPYIPVGLCENLILQSVDLATCIEIISEDIIYNNVTIKPLNTNELTVEMENSKNFWEYNQEEYCNQVKDYVSYGFGASEIITDTNNQPVELRQIPADTLRIYKQKIDGRLYYYAEQKVNGNTTRLRLHNHQKVVGYDYLETDKELPVCYWIGGGRKSNWYDYPLWINAFNHVSASVNLDMLDADKISEGNLVSGILVIKRPPTPILPDNEDVEDTLQEKMENHGSGVFTLELTTLNPNIPLDIDYIQISESNYDYLQRMANRAEDKILAQFRIPKARLLKDETTESMNSNKTNTLYKIYTGELNNRQRPLERNMQIFNRVFYGFDAKVELETPVFVDDKDLEAESTIKIFNNGLITLGQAIRKIETIYPDLQDTDNEIDYNNPLYNERYYNGNPLGLTDAPMDAEQETLYRAGDFIDMAKIEEVFSRESTD